MILKVFESTTADTISQVGTFILESGEACTEASVPTALIVIGPSNSTYTNIVRSVEAQLQEKLDVALVDIAPSQIVNLKSALKFINNRVTGAALTVEEDGLPRHEQSSRRLNYDLQVLCDHIRFHSIAKVILAFQDSETFDGALLNDIIGVIRVAQIDLDSVLQTLTSSKLEKRVWLGPGIIRSIMQTQQDSIQSIASFTRSLQYAHMTHIFANPLGIFLKDPIPTEIYQAELYECVRNLDSFRQRVEELLDQKDLDTAQRLLHEDTFLHEQIEQGITKGKKDLESLIAAVELIASIQKPLGVRATDSWCNLYTQAMAGQLKESHIVKDTLLAVRKSSSDTMAKMLEDLAHSPLPDRLVLLDEVRQLQSEKEGTEPLRSKHDTNYAGLRTTIVSHKVELSKQTASLSKQDILYSEFVNRVEAMLNNHLQEALITPRELFLHEILIYDFRSPHREVFAPKPRHSVERALSLPRDYLGCDCCKGTQHGLSATHPVTSILYQLFLESGAIINTSDLWSAFNTIVGSEENEDEDAEQERTL
ncbi:MAG: hypothetical protein Q9215_005219 [Flavoplaca cf. flavocitrina]